MDEFLTDEQQADVVRKWIRENGGYMLGGLVIGPVNEIVGDRDANLLVASIHQIGHVGAI